MTITSQSQIDAMPPFPFPNLSDGGEFENNWEEVAKPFFVDKTGRGRMGDPALTYEEFRAKLEVGKAYAIIDEGHFQLHIGVFRRKESA